MVIRKLILADLGAHKVRAGLTIAAIALAVSLIISVTSGYASIEAAILHYYDFFMGPVDAQITKQNDPHGGVPIAAETAVRQDPAVQWAVGRIETTLPLLDQSGKPLSTTENPLVCGIDGAQDPRVRTMELTAGQWFAGRDGDGAVIDQVAQDVLKADIGDTLRLGGFGGELRLRVCGIVHKPTIMATQIQTIYLPVNTLQRFLLTNPPTIVATSRAGEAATQPDATQAQYTRIFIGFKPETDTHAFMWRFGPVLHKIDPTLELHLQGQNRDRLQEMLSAVRIPSYVGSGISMVAAAFIIFTTLSMGVAERQRTLAMLRAVGATRSLLGKLVLGEGIALAIVGIVLGIPLGLLWIYLLAARFKAFFTAGVAVSAGGLAFAAGCSLAAALAASLLPAAAAMRLRPMEAMTPLSQVPRSRVPAWTVLAGLLLISIDPLFLFGTPIAINHWATDDNLRNIARDVGFYGHLLLGLPSLMLGFFLLGPMMVWVLDGLASRPLAAIFGVRPALLKQQISSSLWRSAGTGAALMVGLAILIAMQSAGRTSLGGWKLPDKFPDIFLVTYKPGGLDPAQVNRLQRVKGIKQIMPIAIAAPGLGSNIFALAGAALVPNSTMFIGVDPKIAFDLMELDFREGNAADAKRMLQLGRHVIITQEFRELRGLHVGDKLTLQTIVNGPVDYTVAGVVWSPGIDVIVSNYDISRQFDQRTVASVFGTLADAQRDFGVSGYYMFAANLQGDVSKSKLLEQVNKVVGIWGVHAGDVRQLKQDIRDGVLRILLLASTVAFAAMGVASLGVSNTVMAAVRSRRWQFGILRSIGVTRGGLVRLVLAESALLGLIGAAMGVAAGLELAVDIRQVNRVVIGYRPPLYVPWAIVGGGAAAVVAIALLAALWPAISIARQTPLELLQAGRSST
jgi:putative ABC transport system permease protein